MKKKLLLFLSTVFSIISGYAQDSLYYSMLWKPTFTYRRAGVIDEEVFGYRYKDGVFQDSVLLHRNLFDSLGQLIRMDVYHGSILRARHQYFYSGNRLDSMTQEGIWIKPKITHLYSYDTSGNLALLEIFHGAAKSRQERYTYYGNNQPFQTFQKLDRRPETLISQYKYRKDRLIQQADYFFENGSSKEHLSYLYTYTDGTRRIVQSFQRGGKEKRLIDCIKTYNEKGQLMENLKPPLPANERLPIGTYLRPDESVETYRYYQNGLLAEVTVAVNDRPVWAEKHFYFLQKSN